MLNAFPQSAADLRGLLLTYDEALTGLDDDAICVAAARFIRGEVSGQNRSFAPSVAEFAAEVRRTPIPGRRALPPADRSKFRRDDTPTRIRMGFKMAVLSAGFAIKDGADMVSEANSRGLEDLIALGQQWGVPVPEELWAQLRTAA